MQAYNKRVIFYCIILGFLIVAVNAKGQDIVLKDGVIPKYYLLPTY